MSEKILFPIGRLIGGSVSKLKPRMENDGKTPKLNKDGTPSMTINFGVAIPKTQADWRNEPWGATMFNIGKGAFPQMHLSPAFAWKVIDGDSAAPNKNGKAPVTLVGYAGNWVIWFSQGWAPKLVTADGMNEMPAERFVAGYYVQVYADVAGNGAVAPNTPGLYVNPVAVALAGEGEVINVEVDTTAVGFGGDPLPLGAKPVTPAVAAFAPPPAAPGAATASIHVAPAPIHVAPAPAFMAPPPPPVSPVTPAAFATPQRVMLPKAGGATYDSFIANGWTDEAMIANGYMVIQ